MPRCAARQTGQVTLPAAVASATYNADNQLTNWAGTTFSYDLNGNLTSDGASTGGVGG